MKHLFVFLSFIVFSCQSEERGNTKSASFLPLTDELKTNAIVQKTFDNKKNSVSHIIVALCDNEYQGIVPVPQSIGNGQDPQNNLYWGCAYGVKTYFKKQKEWTLIKQYYVDSVILERIIFTHKNKKDYLIADAYNGKFIKKATHHFLHSLSGQLKDTIVAKGKTLGINGNAKLLAYIGHDGLMDFELDINKYENIDNKQRDAIILACFSRNYFKNYLSKINANPILWSTHLMSPEAYTLDAGLDHYIKGANKNIIRQAAAKAYNKYQKCGYKGALNLLVN